MLKCLCFVVSLSQHSSRDLLYVKCFVCVLSRYLNPVVEICYMLNVLCVLSPRYLSPVVEICYMLNVCVCCPRYLSQVVEISDMLNVCVCCLIISAQ